MHLRVRAATSKATTAPPSNPLGGRLCVELPRPWTVLVNTVVSGGLAGVTSFFEAVDDEVVITIATRHHSGSPEELLIGLAGRSLGPFDLLLSESDLELRPGVSGSALHETVGSEEFLMAALVLDRPDDPGASHVGVEFVAAGEVGAVTERLSSLCSIVSSLELK